MSTTSIVLLLIIFVVCTSTHCQAFFRRCKTFAMISDAEAREKVIAADRALCFMCAFVFSIIVFDDALETIHAIVSLVGAALVYSIRWEFTYFEF